MQFKATRHATAQSFTCGRCGRQKVSKNTYEWTTDAGETKTICNGCHGELIAKTPTSRPPAKTALPQDDGGEVARKMAADLRAAGFEVVDGDEALTWSEDEKKRRLERRADQKRGTRT